MAIYHLSWDFAYFHLAPSDLPTNPPMRLFSHVVAGAFLFLAGVSLALAHPGGLRRAAFRRRLAIVGGAAALRQRGDLFFRAGRSDPVRHSSLHRLASLLAAPLIALPAWIALVLSALVLAAPWFLASAAFNPPALVWLGLGTVLPQTLDWRPLAPWAAFVFLGLATDAAKSAAPDRFAARALAPVDQRLARRSPGRGAIAWRSISSISRCCSPFSMRRPA